MIVKIASLIKMLLRFFFRHSYRRKRLTRGGFTLLELITVMAIVAILMAVIAPGWTRFLDTQRLISAQNVVYQGIQEAQSKAQQTRSEWQFSIRDINGSVEWSVHSEMTPSLVSDWSLLGSSSVQIDDETTLQSLVGGRTVRFDHKGNVTSRLGRVTLSSRRMDGIKRCVYVSTLIGALRQSKEQDRPRDGDFCY